MMITPKRILTLHDVCTLGRCSTVTATAVLAACGVQPCPLVTALLSSTVDFGDFYASDTLDAVQGSVPYLKRFVGHFDGIYTGYLGGPGQVDTVLDVFAQLGGTDTLRIVDPVMGDGGALYTTFDHEMVQQMQRLTAQADVILPNLTEARLLGGLPADTPLTLEQTAQLAQKLSHSGNCSVIITGAQQQAGKVTTLCYDRETRKLYTLTHTYIDQHFPGSGDLFASVLTGAYLSGATLLGACRQACGFVGMLMELAQDAPLDAMQGLPYEPYLYLLHDSFVPKGVEIQELSAPYTIN